jgi:hypothetical protein
MNQITGPDDTPLYVDRTQGTRGQNGPFYVVYEDEDGTERWGFFCSNCETVDNAVDAMGRIQCNQCSNRTKAEEWDAAHE